jgi:two-component system, sensor histidine kinase
MFTKSMQIFSDSKNHTWNLGTWLLLMLILLAGSYISYYARSFTDSLLLYMPTSLAFIMVHWFGLRILPLAFINAFVTLFLWQAPGPWERILFLASREPVIVFVSWILCKNLISNSKGLSNTQVFVKFVFGGILIPDLINSLYTYNYTFIGGDLEKVALLWLSDFITIFSIAVPVLHYFRPEKTPLSFTLVPNEPQSFKELNRKGLFEIFLITILFLVLGFFISFDKYWFVYGVCATFIAVRHGFCYVIFINGIIFIFNYILPLINFGSLEYGIHASTQLFNVHLGMSTMFFGSALIGRVISDLRNSEKELTVQKRQIESANSQLSKTNHEMDRFVYSVSHDISAPLKSIRGLIAVSKLESNNNSEFPYISRIEQSVKKLEDFTEEILEHSRASRKEIEIEEVNLHHHLEEIFDNLKFLNGYSAIRFTLQLDYPHIKADRFLLKVILSNLISNAVKFQKQENGVVPEIKIRSFARDNVFIEVEDNGEGIVDSYKNRIFEMFYRATTTSTGSGLGLFIANEAALKLNGVISFKSKHGEGSIFTIELPLHK